MEPDTSTIVHETPATIQVAGLAVDTYGIDDGRPPLVLLHGLTYDRTMWRPALDELRRRDADRRVVSIDLPGHGGSRLHPGGACCRRDMRCTPLSSNWGWSRRSSSATPSAPSSPRCTRPFARPGPW